MARTSMILPLVFALYSFAGRSLAQFAPSDDYWSNLSSRQEQVDGFSLPFPQTRGSPNLGSFSVLGGWAWGPVRAVNVRDDVALVGQGYVYQVFDISNPSQPTILYDTTLTEEIFGITIQDSVLFIMMNHTVIFADARTPFPLREFGRFTAPVYGLKHISVSDTFMYLLPDWAFGFAVGIAQLTNPYILAWFPVWNTTGFEGTITSKGRFVYYQPYCPCAYYVMEYLPDSNCFRYRSIGGFVGGYHSIVSDTLLMIAAVDGFRVYSISDQWIPVLLSNIDLGSPVRYVAARGSRVYAGTEYSGVVTIDISNPSMPIIVGRSLSAVTGKFSINDSLLAVASVAELGLPARIPGLQLYDTASSDSLIHLHHFPTPYPPAYDITLHGNIGFSNYSNGIWAVDYSDLDKPRVLAHTLIPTRSKLARSGDIIAFISSLQNTQTLVLARLNDSGSVSLLSQTPYAGTVWALEARESLLLVLSNDSLSIFSIADPLSPLRLASWEHGNSTGESDVSVADDLAYLSLRGSMNSGLVILDISNPSSPQLITTVLQNCRGVLVVDTTGYVFTPNNLNIMGMSNPISPSLLSTFSVQSSRTMVRGGRFLYVLHQGLNAIDVSNPYYPRSAGEIPSPNLASSSGLEVRGDSLFIVNSQWNIGILRHDHVSSVDDPPGKLPWQTRLLQNYPNPFNRETNIRFEIPTRGRVTLTVHDLLGRTVFRVEANDLESGSHTITWSPGEIASGVYFCRLQVNDGTVNIRSIILLK